MEKSHISKDEALDTISAIRSDIKEDKEIFKKEQRFQRHLLVYVLVIAMLWGINWYSLKMSGQYGGHPVWWAIYPTLGWGIGLLLHFIRTR